MRESDSLAHRMKKGDRSAFEEFVDSYGARLHRLVLRSIPNIADAEDVTQEIFMDIYRSIGGFRGESALNTWVYKIAMHHCFKASSRRRADCDDIDAQIDLASDDWRTNPEQSADKQELSQQVHSALGKLPNIQRDVVLLHEMHGLTYQECAAALDIPVGTVKSRLSNAFRRLRISLGGYVLDEDSSFPKEILRESAL